MRNMVTTFCRPHVISIYASHHGNGKISVVRTMQLTHRIVSIFYFLFDIRFLFFFFDKNFEKKQPFWNNYWIYYILRYCNDFFRLWKWQKFSSGAKWTDCFQLSLKERHTMNVHRCWLKEREKTWPKNLPFATRKSFALIWIEIAPMSARFRSRFLSPFFSTF